MSAFRPRTTTNMNDNLPNLVTSTGVSNKGPRQDTINEYGSATIGNYAHNITKNNAATDFFNQSTNFLADQLDTASKEWAEANIRQATEDGMQNGYTNNPNFKPTDTAINRAHNKATISTWLTQQQTENTLFANETKAKYVREGNPDGYMEAVQLRKDALKQRLEADPNTKPYLQPLLNQLDTSASTGIIEVKNVQIQRGLEANRAANLQDMEVTKADMLANSSNNYSNNIETRRLAEENYRINRAKFTDRLLGVNNGIPEFSEGKQIELLNDFDREYYTNGAQRSLMTKTITADIMTRVKNGTYGPPETDAEGKQVYDKEGNPVYKKIAGIIGVDNYQRDIVAFAESTMAAQNKAADAAQTAFDTKVKTQREYIGSEFLARAKGLIPDAPPATVAEGLKLLAEGKIDQADLNSAMTVLASPPTTKSDPEFMVYLTNLEAEGKDTTAVIKANPTLLTPEETDRRMIRATNLKNGKLDDMDKANIDSIKGQIPITDRLQPLVRNARKRAQIIEYYNELREPRKVTRIVDGKQIEVMEPRSPALAIQLTQTYMDKLEQGENAKLQDIPMYPKWVKETVKGLDGKEIQRDSSVLDLGAMATNYTKLCREGVLTIDQVRAQMEKVTAMVEQKAKANVNKSELFEVQRKLRTLKDERHWYQGEFGTTDEIEALKKREAELQASGSNTGIAPPK